MSEPTPNVQDMHERELVRAFFMPQRRERYLEMLLKPRKRANFLKQLSHFKHLDYRYLVTIRPNQQHSAEILTLLKAKHAPDVCWAISEDSELDGKQLLLSEALKSVVGYGMGTFLSCLPGQLAYFEDEDQRWILERKANS
jgi:hypothetical protein